MLKHKGILVALAALVLGAVATATVAQGQTEVPPGDVPPAVLYDGKIVYDVTLDPIQRYYLVQSGLRRAVDPTQYGSRIEIVGIYPEELDAIPEGSPIITTPAPDPATPFPTVAPTGTPTPLAGATSQAGRVGVSTVVTWSTPGPVDPNAQRPAVRSLQAGRRGGEDIVVMSSPDGRLFRYREGPMAWEDLTTRLTIPPGSVGGPLLLTREDPPVLLYVTTERPGGDPLSTVHRSTDGGDTWSRQAVPGASARVLYQLHGSRDTLYMGTNDGVLLSLDGGQSWQVQTGLPMVGVAIWAVANDPGDPRHIVVGGQALEGTGQLRGRLFDSLDGGSSWAEISFVGGQTALPTILALTFDPSASGRFLIGVDGGSGLLEAAPPTPAALPVIESTATVTPTATPTPTGRLVIRAIGSTALQRVTSLAFRPGGIFASGAPAGVVRAGVTSPDQIPPPPIATLTTRSDGSFVLPALSPGIYTVEISGKPRPPDLLVGAIPFAFSGSGGAGGVFLSSDGGLSFADVTGSLDTRTIGSVTWSQDGRLLFVGAGAPQLSATPGPGGVFRGTTS